MQFITDMIFSTSSATKIRMHQMQIADSKLRPTGNTTLSYNTHWSHGPAFSIVDSHRYVNHVEKLCGRIFSLWLLNTRHHIFLGNFLGRRSLEARRSKTEGSLSAYSELILGLFFCKSFYSDVVFLFSRSKY